MEVASFTSAVETNSEDLLAYFERRIDRHEEAADLLAEVLHIAWRRHRICPDDKVRARMWLYKIAANVLANHRRAARRRTALADRLREHLATTGRDGPSEMSAAVADAVRALPSEHRELVALVHWDGFSIAEAAEILGVGASTARSRYAVAKASLRRRLEAGQTV